MSEILYSLDLAPAKGSYECHITRLGLPELNDPDNAYVLCVVTADNLATHEPVALSYSRIRYWPEGAYGFVSNRQAQIWMMDPEVYRR